MVADPSHLAPAISFMYLTSTVALTIGLPLSNAVMQAVLRRALKGRLLGLGVGAGEVVKVPMLSSLGVSCFPLPFLDGVLCHP